MFFNEEYGEKLVQEKVRKAKQIFEGLKRRYKTLAVREKDNQKQKNYSE